MKLKSLALGALLLGSLSAHAGTYEVKGWSGCTIFVDPLNGLTRFTPCQQEGTYEADSCDDAYNKLREDKKCCEWMGGHVQKFTKRSCETK